MRELKELGRSQRRPFKTIEKHNIQTPTTTGCSRTQSRRYSQGELTEMEAFGDISHAACPRKIASVSGVKPISAR